MAAGVRLRGMRTVWEVESALIYSGRRMLMAYAERRSGCFGRKNADGVEDQLR